jgi:UDP:flavonoid glycosyltransferase YjiC (YdhE family)
MRVLLVTIGSHGDINPFIAIGRALRALGHDAAVMTNPYFNRQVEEAGLAFLPVGERLDLTRVHETMPDLMHPRRGSKVVLDLLVGKFSTDSYTPIREAIRRERFDAVVHHHIALSAAWAADTEGVPAITAVLAPMMWMSRGDVLTPMSWSPLNPGPMTRWAMHTLGTPIMNWIMDGFIAKVRRDLRLSKAKGEYLRITRGGVANLGLWSPVLRGPCEGDPPTGTICGFPWHDRHDDHDHAGERLEHFLASGEPPILFTLGTAAVHVAGDFYHHAAEACRLLRRRGLLLVGPGRTPPNNLPADCLAVDYAKFSAVMPRCAVNVHHGGIGSTGQALRAGRPTLVIPHAHDQFDNAARVQRLGVSLTLPRPKVTARRLADQLARLLDDPRAHAEAARTRPILNGEDGAQRAAERIVAM